ncbi:MAG: hypothetical protein H0X29_02580 [Parachlamydiaceae bacterium]|nr:hypothetical protein [Parachlamydiaceae bacterium]
MNNIVKSHAPNLNWPLVDKQDPLTLPSDLASIFHTYVTMENCIELSLAGNSPSSKILTKSIAAAGQKRIARFVANAYMRRESDYQIFKKMIEIFFKHASTSKQAHFFASITDKNGRFITDIISALPKGLAHLDLTNCKWLKNHHVTEIIMQLPALESLNLSKCRFLTDETAKIIANKNNAASLHSLNFSGCPKLTDFAAIAIAESTNLVGLNSLKFSKCPHITDMGAMAITNSMSGLRRLKFRQCPKVTATARTAIKNMLVANAHRNKLAA